MCMAVIVACIGSAAASDSGDQSSSPLATGTQTQSASVSLDDNKVSYNLNQEQSAKIISGDGEISAAQQSGVNVEDKGKGKVTIVTARASEVQSADTSSSDSIDSSTTRTSNAVKTLSVSKDESASIDLTQGPTVESGANIYQKQTAFLKIIDTPHRNIAIVHILQK